MRYRGRVRRLPFEDDDLTLVPWAGRRALDAAGRKLSLRGWQGLSLLARQAIVGLGAEDEVDVVRVRELIEGAHPEAEAITPPSDPPRDRPSPEVAAALGEVPEWPSLSPVARYALHAYASRGKHDKLRAAYASMSSGASQSDR